jgi:hypothetical protein
MALEFQINLSGNFVEALDKSNKALGDTEKETHKAGKALETFEGELGKVKAGALGINFSAIQEGGKLFTFDLAEGAALAFEAIKKVGEAVIDLGKEIIKTVATAEDLNLAIKLDVGEEGAEKVNKLAESFQGTRFDDKLIKEALLPILEESGDEHSDQWDDLLTAATDVATRRNTGTAGAKAALGALRSIEIQPQKIKGSLKELGIKQKDFYDDLGDLLGISAVAAEKQVKAGKVKSQTLLSVALNQIAEREGGALGNATNQGAKTLGTALERLGNLKENLFEKLVGSPGFAKLQEFLTTFVDTMEGDAGTELMGKIGDAFAEVFGYLASPEGIQRLENGVKSVASGIGSAVDAATVLFHWFTKIVDAAGAIAAPLNSLRQVGLRLAGGGSDEGEAGGGNVGGKFKNRLRELFAAGKIDQAGIAQALSTGVIPAFASGGIVDRPTLALVGEAGPEAIVPLGGGRHSVDLGGGPSSGGGPSISIEMNISTQARDGHELARDLEPEMRVMLKRVLVEAGAALGVAT